jgi:hypothetical protein
MGRRTNVHKESRHGRFPYNGVRLTSCWSEEFDIAAVLEEQLKVLRIEPKLMEGAANLSGRRIVGRGPGPALVPPFVLELEETAIREKHRGLVEFRIGDVARGGRTG